MNSKITLLERTKDIPLFNEDLIERNKKTLLHRYEIAKKKGVDTKENLTLLERGFMEGNELTKIGRHKRKKPAVIEKIEINVETITPYDDRFEKYNHYIQKYKIPFFSNGIRKSFKDLAYEIHRYEMRHKASLIKKGLDHKYKEYGYYINVV
jgi:dihydropteroate synthase